MILTLVNLGFAGVVAATYRQSMEDLNLSGFLFGNIDEEGKLENDFLDEELRTALTKREVSAQIGIDFSLGIAKEDLELSKVDKASYKPPVTQVRGQIDFSNIDEAVPDTMSSTGISAERLANRDTDINTTNSLEETATEREESMLTMKNLYLTKDGKILRFSNFFSSKPAHNDGKYRPKRLRLGRKKALVKPVIYMEDQVEIFRKLPQSHGGASTIRPSFYQQILANATMAANEKKKTSSRGKQLEDIFESRPPVTEHFLLNPDVLRQVSDSFDRHKFHPIGLIEWEENIIFDAIKPLAGPSRNSYLYAGVPPITSLNASSSRVGSASGPSSRPNTPMASPFNLQSQFQPRLSLQHPSSQLHQLPPLNPLLSQRSSLSASSSRANTPILHVIAPRSIAGRIINTEFASGKWAEQIIWDDNRLPYDHPPTNLQLSLNDPNLIFESVDMTNLTEKILKTEKLIHKRLKKLRHGTTSDGKALVLAKFDKSVSDRFNLSNDKNYETVSKEGTNSTTAGRSGTVPRAIISSSRVGVQHSVPALKLSLPFYKTFWTKTELRAWHRPKLDINNLIGHRIIFEKLIKTKESVTRKISAGVLNAARKISLRDRSSDYVLIEYSEEFPLLMMNVGMATFLLNFHRKQQAKDVPNLPDFPFGSTKILEPNEASPFWFFGDVRPGQTLTIIQNNLFRAPLFDHNALNTDFIILKFNLKGKAASKWFIKDMPPRLTTVGQVFPTAEVFGPHSRRHNLFCRARIQSFAYRLFRKDTKGNQYGGETDFLPRLKISRIMAAFPQFSEGSLRKWLKEYADSVRTGHDSGTWRMRRDAPILTEEDIRALITPEMICQYESMLAGQQRLNDAGFMDSPEVEGAIDDDLAIDNESAEVRLAPWNLSANFINATMSKCTLQLHGIGDPSGRGEAFSFVKVPLKISIGTKLSAISETERRSSIQSPHQQASGSSVNTFPSKLPTKLSTEQVTYRQEIVKIWDAQMKALNDPVLLEDDTISQQQQDFSIFEERDDDVTSLPSKSSQTRLANRRLLIRRIIQDPSTGKQREETETITDARLISAYINQRRVWERKRRRREIAAAASAARAKKARPEGTASIQFKTRRPSKPKKEVYVKCGTCGQIGHMRTNRICPRYAEYEAELEKEQKKKTPMDRTELKISISKVALQNTAQHSDLEVIKADSPLRLTPLLHYTPKPRKKKGMDIDSLDSEQRQAFSYLNERLAAIINTLIEFEGSWPFHRPVSKIDYPYYYRMIAKPLDFGTIRSRIKRNFYGRAGELLDDIKLIRDNCIQFNGPDHPFSTIISNLYNKATEELEKTEIKELEFKIYGTEPGMHVSKQQLNEEDDIEDEQLHIV